MCYKRLGLPHLPTNNISRSVAVFLIFFQMSIVNKVLELLKMEVSEDMRAARSTASITPLEPVKVNKD